MAFRIEFNNLNEPIPDSTGLLPRVDNPNYQDIFRRVQSRDGPVPRSKKGFIGCKISQVVNTLICLIWKPELNRAVSPQILNYIVKFLIAAYDKCMDHSEKALYEFIRNNPTYMNYLAVDSSNLSLIIDPKRSSFFIMALVKDPLEFDRRQYPYGTISHYFTIIIRDSMISILSSYGSACVAVPQKETPLELSELLLCIQALEEQRSDETKQTANEVVVNFIKKFFLSDGEIKRESERDEETSRMKHTTVRPKEGIEMEIETYTKGLHRFFYFPEYVDLVRKYSSVALSEMPSRGGSKRLRKNRRTRRNKKSRKSRRSRRHKK
jgi:hypothetical protein